MKANGWIKLSRSELKAQGSLSDREFRYYIMALGECIWDGRNQLAGTFDARTLEVKRSMLPKWSVGKINMTKNSLIMLGLLSKTKDSRRLRVNNIQNMKGAPIMSENSLQKHEPIIQGRELSPQEREEWLRRIRESISGKPKE